MNILIIGCGWLGQKVGRELILQSHQVYGTYRSEETRIRINDLDIEALSINALKELKVIDTIDIVLLFTPPNKQLPIESYGKQLLDYTQLFGNTTRFIFSSSTGIYPKKEGVFDENYLFQETEKDTHLYKAEALLTAALKERLLVFRLGGLIGEDRNPIHRLSGKALPTNGQSIPYLVHAKDVCGVIQHFFSKYKWGGTFNLFTETMKTKRQYYIEQAVKRGIEKPIFGMKYDIKRKLINDKITKEFGFQFTKLS